MQEVSSVFLNWNNKKGHPHIRSDGEGIFLVTCVKYGAVKEMRFENGTLAAVVSCDNLEKKYPGHQVRIFALACKELLQRRGK